MEYILSANGLYKSYKNFKALNGLSMNVPKGAIYGFVGKNGAGKTTLIRIICGLRSLRQEIILFMDVKRRCKNDRSPQENGSSSGDSVYLRRT